MKTVFDYIEYYKNKNYEECPFNDMDNIIFSIISYLPLDSIDKPSITIKEISKKLGQNQTNLRSMKKVAFKVLENIKESIRYSNIIISNYISILDETTQFSAMTIRYKNNECYVAYRGTDNSLTGWRENLELGYKYPTNCQKHAIDYLKNTITEKDQIVYVGGHSKGGNLAMTAAMETSTPIFNKIKTVYNNDGPGFKEEEYNSEKYKNMQTKLKTFIPEESMVGVLLFSNEKYTIVKSKDHGPYQHYPSNWLCFGQFLEPGKLSKYSQKIQKQINDYVKDTSYEDKKTMVSTLFDVLEKQNIKYFHEVRNMSFKEFSDLIKDAKGVDEKSKEVIIEMIKSFLFNEIKTNTSKQSE